MGAPDTVTTQLKLSKAAHEHRVAMIAEELDRTPVATVRSRKLRREREQLAESVAAWDFLIVQSLRYRSKGGSDVPEVR